MKFSINDFFSKCDQIRRKLWIWSHLLKKSLIENFIFCPLIIAKLFILDFCESYGYASADDDFRRVSMNIF